MKDATAGWYFRGSAESFEVWISSIRDRQSLMEEAIL